MITEPAYCTYCQAEVDKNHWYWMKDNRYKANGKWRCRQAKRDAGKRYREKRKQDTTRLEANRSYQRQYHQDNKHIARFKSYVSADKRAGRANNLTREFAFRIMNQPCHYCHIQSAGGLDRFDSNKGHLQTNCVPCCEKCNYILGDMPPQAKLLLQPGLAAIRNQGLLDDWVIPTKRGSK